MNRVLGLIVSLLIAAAVACPALATRPPDEAGDDRPPAFSVLVFSKTAGFRHGSIPVAIEAIEALGAARGFTVDATEDASVFTDAGLDPYRAVIFLSTTGDVLDPEQQAAFERYIQGGRGYVGIHAASDTEYDWPWYGQLVGAYFASHPRIQDAQILVTDRRHPSTRHLPDRWDRHDEWYDFQDNPRGRVHVLASLDEGSYEGGGMGHDHPTAWCHLFDGGRAWYTGGGHTDESFEEPEFMDHVLGGILWAAGQARGDANATIDAAYRRTVLVEDVDDPMELAIAPDGRVIFIERAGAVRIWKPESNIAVTAGAIDVYSGLEDGLLGLALDPGFGENGWIYVYYGWPGDEAKNVLSRFTLKGDVLDPGSEIIILEVPTQREECCHSGGSIAFDSKGNLLLSTGDNTNPFTSNGYAPIDEREGRSAFDAQKSASNPQDLRGKILRIEVAPDGDYKSTNGNLYEVEADGRPEIFVMGCRNPFRISVDPRRGTVFWGDVGPDAGDADPNRGPGGHDEINRAEVAGNYGWPYFLADNRPYREYDFEKNESGPPFDPAHPVNDSPNNTGAGDLPAARPAWIWYPYGPSEMFPELGAGGRCAMAGPMYRFDPAGTPPGRFPAYFDGALFIYDWSRDWIRAVMLDGAEEILKVDPFLESVPFQRPMDMAFGPDGRMYVIEWGSNFGGRNADARIVRIEYLGAMRR